MTGDTTGKLSAIIMPFLIVEKKKSDYLSHLAIRRIYNKECTLEMALDYANQMIKFGKQNPSSKSPCSEPKPPVCCGFIAKLISDNLEYFMVVMKYTIPNYFNNHTVLANFLGFDGSKNYGLHGHVANTAPYCAVPGIADVLPCSDKDMRVFWTSEGICATINAPPVNSIFKVKVQ